MFDKINSFLEKIKFTNNKVHEFKNHFFNNFFGDFDETFKNDKHVEDITQFCFDNVEKYKNDENFTISIKEINGNVGYCIVMKDRPFIVDSVLGWIKSESIHPVVFMHPNFFFNHKTQQSCDYEQKDFQRYSIIYFEISESLTEEQRNALKDVLFEVYISTEYYLQMKEFLLSFANSVKDFEVQKLIEWLCDDAFVILGLQNGEKSFGVSLLEKYKNFCDTNILLNLQNMNVVVTKSLMISPVHRRDPIDIIFIKNGEDVIKIYGIFTTHSYRCKLLDIPIVRKKIEEIVKHADFQVVSYNRKELFSFFENLPREELFSTTKEFLLNVGVKYIESITRGKTFVYHRKSDIFPFAIFAVFTPNVKFTISLFKRISSILEEVFCKNNVAKTFGNTHSIGRVVMSFFVDTKNCDTSLEEMHNLSRKIIEICESSEDGLLEALKYYKALNPSLIMKKYEGALSPGYIIKRTSLEISKDIFEIESLSNEKPCKVRVVSHNEGDVDIKIYSVKQQSLYKIIRILEQCGIIVSSEDAFEIVNDEIGVFVHDIIGKVVVKSDVSLVENHNFIDVVEKALCEEIPHTNLNRLSVTSQTNARNIFFLRLLAKYLKQIQFIYQEDVIYESLAENSEMTKKLLELFYMKFDPSVVQNRDEEIKKIEKNIKEISTKILNVAHDATLMQIYRIIKGMVRTNFFLNKEYVSIKLDCKQIPNLPKPVPFREIFVHSRDFEAVHLRFGKVARGGLRWSDRQNDFRTEVLGLVKAQNTKNAVIVPVGSKGGFTITKNVSGLSKNEYFEFGQECYRKFLSACLDLADNITVNGVETHDGIIKWEDEDPYFVVAADKGTATFSDIANSISQKYNFWLGDAFASGGSNGYDHKKMGITAKGGWIAVRRHMMEVGIDIQEKDFSVVGIGDMSGDVYGNGMLLSKHICLIATFNHMHIFVDPNPNAEKSFKERERMFNLPRSTWADYDRTVISQGGEIFERSAKICKLTPEIKARFEIDADELTPNELIVAILKSKYDLLWNGGIGTYVKSSDEKNIEVGDKANDAIRVNGNELRCTVIGEGGNLGMTQKGRIEFAQNGGKLNTDAMDNSAGVNCSDVEVNIKIVLNKLTNEGKISLENRNILLSEMTPEVSRLVLRNNYLQTQAITIALNNQSVKMDSQENLMQVLENQINLDRENELLPSTLEMKNRKLQKDYLTRPELCVLFAYSKIYLYQELLKSKLIEEKYFENDLLSYFPKEMQEKFKNDILSHKLAKEIIATSVNNSIINRVGITFVTDVIAELQCKPCDVVRAYTVIRELFNLRKIWYAVELLDFKIDYKVQIDIFDKINHFINKCVKLLLNRTFEPVAITKMVENFAPFVNDMIAYISNNSDVANIQEKSSKLTEANVPNDVANNITITLEAMQMFNIVFETKNKNDLPQNIKTYFDIMKYVQFEKIVKWISLLSVENSLQKLAINTLEEKLYTKYCQLVCRISLVTIASWKEEKVKQLEKFSKLIDDISLLEKQNFAMISMIVDKLDIL